MNAAELYAEHRGDLESAKRAGYFADGGVSDLGGGRPSPAQLEMDRDIAWGDFEDALAAHEPRAASDALSRWSDAIGALRAIGESR